MNIENACRTSCLLKFRFVEVTCTPFGYCSCRASGCQENKLDTAVQLLQPTSFHLYNARGVPDLVSMPAQLKNYGYLEDRRPAANVDPYTVARLLIKTTFSK